MFDWLSFLEQRRIDYISSGKSVTRGNVAVHCPFCGADDPSYHMGISLTGRGWGCWRNAQHRGKSDARLVAALIRCTMDQARVITGGQVFIPVDFAGTVNALMAPKDEAPIRKLKLPPEFSEFSGDPKPSANLFISYLWNRGYSYREIAGMTRHYGMRYCTRGPYKGRIIFPIKHDYRLISWTGRTVYPSVDLRYKVLSPDVEKARREGMEPAVGINTDYLLWYDDLMADDDADTVVITEGPFDALRVRVLGRDRGITATCLFTSEPHKAQIELLHEVLPRFKRRFLMLDADMFPTAIRVSAALSGTGIMPKMLPAGVKDPGELSRDQLLDII